MPLPDHMTSVRWRTVTRILATLALILVAIALIEVLSPFRDSAASCFSDYRSPFPGGGEAIGVVPAGLSIMPLGLACEFTSGLNGDSAIVQPDWTGTVFLACGLAILLTAVLTNRRMTDAAARCPSLTT